MKTGPSLWSTLDIADIFHIVEDLKQATEREQQIAHQIREAGMGYIVDGLESKKPAPPDWTVVNYWNRTGYR